MEKWCKIFNSMKCFGVIFVVVVVVLIDIGNDMFDILKLVFFWCDCFII